MSKKITISVPDFLHDKIEKWRGSFNLSRLFQEAVSDAIKKKEELGKRLKNEINIPEIVERLKKEKLETEEQYFEDGSKTGVEWASRAHYKDLKEALKHPLDSLTSLNEDFRTYFSHILKQKKLLNLKDESTQNHYRLFLDGWKKGVEEFWDSIKEKLGEN